MFSVKEISIRFIAKMQATCKYCTKAISHKDAPQHFISCNSRIQFFEKRNQTRVNHWFYIRAQSSPYWMDILIPNQWKLDDLDFFLRHIWLECCGHLSHFCIQEVNYEQFEDSDWLMEGEVPPPGMDICLNKVLSVGSKFSHIYDYGSTTELQLKVLKELQFPVKKQIFLYARNLPPIFECEKCKNIASQICAICSEHYCEKCAKLNIKNSYCNCEHIFLPLVNSPRTGVCGYDGAV